jgi:tetratricopeptide (TPR) repeat protein
MPEAAIGWLERAAQQVPGYLPALRDLVDLHLTTDSPDRALDLLVEASEQWPSEVWIHVRLGHLYQQLRLSGKAEASLRAALALDADLPAVHSMLGNVLYEVGDYERAADAYRSAVRLDPRDHGSLNNLAWVYAVTGEHLDEAIRLSTRSLRLAPDSPTYLDTLAELYYKKQDYAKATELIQIAISLKPRDPQLRDHLQDQLRKFMAAGKGKV